MEGIELQSQENLRTIGGGEKNLQVPGYTESNPQTERKENVRKELTSWNSSVEIREINNSHSGNIWNF